MSHTHAAEKRLLTFWVDMELYAKFSNVARARGESMSELLTRFMKAATLGVKATDAQNVEMLSRVKANGATRVHAQAAKEAEKRGLHFDPFDFILNPRKYDLSDLSEIDEPAPAATEKKPQGSRKNGKQAPHRP